MSEGASEDPPEQGPVLRFRNYNPRSEELQGLGIEKPAIPTVEEQVDTAQVLHDDATQEPLLNLAPKRANWDLKRDIEPQLKRLRTATDRAIVQLIAARVAAEEKQQQPERGGDAPPDKIDLAAAVEQQQKLDARDEDD